MCTQAAGVMTRLVVFLQIGVLYGPPLPLLGPFLLAVIASEWMVAVAAVAGKEDTLKSMNVDQGGAKTSVSMAVGCSFLFQFCFARESQVALIMLCPLSMLLSRGVSV